MPTRKDILAAAEQVIRDRGVARATTRQIAEVAGCSEGSIYNYFPSKEELVAHAVGERIAAFPARAHALSELAGTGEVADNLTELARLAIGFFYRVAPMMVAMMVDPATMRRCARAIDAAGHGPRWTMRAVVEYLRREQGLGRVRSDASLEGTALCLVGACLQQALLAHAWGEDLLLIDDETAATEIARAVVRGLEAPGPVTPDPPTTEG